MKGGGRPDELGGQQVEGHHAVYELLAAGRRRTRRLWVAEGQVATEPIGRILDLARQQGVAVQRKSPEALLAAAQTAAPQGILAWADPVVPHALDEWLAAPPDAEVPFLLVLDGVTDPGNFGSILRSAACAGVGGVVIGRHRSAPLTPAALKAAAGAVEVVPIITVPGVAAVLARLTKAGIWTVGLDPEARVDLWQSSLLDGPVALVLGSEGDGLSQLVYRRCDALARVPQTGPLSSLNVAVAAAVACFEVARRRSLAGRTGAR
jgi:23S rRNA (guanosine2251-2'-O)-methyltransferase